MKTRLLSFWLLAFLVSLCLSLPASADAGEPTDSRNANGEKIEAATDSDLSDIPNLEKMDYDRFQEYFGDVPGDHVPLLNPDNAKLQIKAKTPGGERMITTKDLVESE